MSRPCGPFEINDSVPNKCGKTPFTLASVGGHLAVTRLIRNYAPAAGTPAGGDAQIQAFPRGRVGGEGGAGGRGAGIGAGIAPDALPRPHSAGWTSGR